MLWMHASEQSFHIYSNLNLIKNKYNIAIHNNYNNKKDQSTNTHQKIY